MPLPFLKKKEASISIPPESVKRKPDNDIEEEFDYIDSASEDLISAIQSKDVKGVSAALRAAFQMMDEMPHVEGPHISEGEQ